MTSKSAPGMRAAGSSLLRRFMGMSPPPDTATGDAAIVALAAIQAEVGQLRAELANMAI